MIATLVRNLFGVVCDNVHAYFLNTSNFLGNLCVYSDSYTHSELARKK